MDLFKADQEEREFEENSAWNPGACESQNNPELRTKKYDGETDRIQPYNTHHLASQAPPYHYPKPFIPQASPYFNVTTLQSHHYGTPSINQTKNANVAREVWGMNLSRSQAPEFVDFLRYPDTGEKNSRLLHNEPAPAIGLGMGYNYDLLQLPAVVKGPYGGQMRTTSDNNSRVDQLGYQTYHTNTLDDRSMYLSHSTNLFTERSNSDHLTSTAAVKDNHQTSQRLTHTHSSRSNSHTQTSC